MVKENKVQLSQETQAIWDEIKNLKTEFCGLKNVFIKDVASPVNIDQHKLFLNLKSSCVVVSVEESLSQLVSKNALGDVVPKYLVEAVKGMAVVSINKE